MPLNTIKQVLYKRNRKASRKGLPVMIQHGQIAQIVGWTDGRTDNLLVEMWDSWTDPIVRCDSNNTASNSHLFVHTWQGV